MRIRSHRSAAVQAAVAGVTAVLLGAAGLAACDAIGGNSPGPRGSTAGTKPSPKPTPAWDTSPRSIAAVGDSITRGFDACSVLTDCPEVSWATGSDAGVRSLAVRLLGKDRAATHSWNYARTGARMADLPAQMEQAAAVSPGLVTVMAGANDACRPTPASMTPVDAFRADFEDAMRTLRREVPKAQVYVSSVPDLKRLWSAGRTNPLGKQVWKLGICSSMLADPDDLAAAATRRRASVQDRVVAYNEVLQEVCAKDRRCRYDGGAVFDYRFDGRQLSHWDWFHPSKDGQSRLAAMAYRRVTAKEPIT
ncbi:SGNH/GDSL hydrolase family protein [Streptomyces sp. NBC_00056]|uniref:SGNH/GDSL hydrolase family protein n=1 Tax=unclassified Streptomyces TaxID=2593676 RepID=UPI00224DE869|nr:MULTISPECIES: SGNH/GDSL hydrolase family protein [unclassified Streptomyces]MCX5437133.1 SGNH/GDSL hydrolase family protein [Streptomyces sp. NBC_00063]WSE14836.1 SGNH/GDSL hydrolase family protein [Streptomyces sp. NBC_01397]WUB96248.1 SGNH/GDSL hydrolase family protein [Streptomyces sp. NBC_00569]